MNSFNTNATADTEFVPGYVDFSHPAAAIEDLSYRYKKLIEAERMHFMEVEAEYNEFIAKMDAIHAESEQRLEEQVKINEELTYQNEEMAMRLRTIESDYNKKKETLKKLYAVHQAQTLRVEHLEKENKQLKDGVDSTLEKNSELSSDVKHILAERNYLDDRLHDIQARHTMELNRLNMVVADKEKINLDREREIDRLRDDVRRLQDENHRLCLDIDSMRMDFDSAVKLKDIEIGNLRKALNEERFTNHSVPVIDDRGSEELIKKLKFDLDQAYRKIDDLMQKKNVQVIERPKLVEKVVTIEKQGFTEHDADVVDRLLAIAEKNYSRRLVRYLYTVWRQEAQIRELIQETNKTKAAANSKPLVVKAEDPHPQIAAVTDSIVDLFNFLRVKIVDTIFEVFVRSANHAYQKKVNSLILFMIQITELKEQQKEPWTILLDGFLRLKNVIKNHTPYKDQIQAQELSNRSGLPVRKTKTADLEFRNKNNLWIESTLDEVKGRRAYDKKDPRNMENLYLFRLLTIKYRVLYPQKGKPIECDVDLTVRLENRICKTLHRVVHFIDEAPEN